MICTWNGCPYQATRNLGFGRYDRRTYRGPDSRQSEGRSMEPMQAQNHRRGRLLTAGYCPDHAAVVSAWFHVEDDSALDLNAPVARTTRRRRRPAVPAAPRTLAPESPPRIVWEPVAPLSAGTVYHLACVEAGLSLRAIAELTGRSFSTLQRERRQIIADFDVPNVTEAIARFVRFDMRAAA